MTPPAEPPRRIDGRRDPAGRGGPGRPASPAGEAPRRRGRRRLVGLLALLGSLLGLRAMVRRRGRRPALPPQGWGRSHHYTWRGDEVHFQQLGDGAPVLLVHSLGLGHSSAEWNRVAELLYGTFGLYAPDLPGWGRSSATRVEPRPRLYVDFLADFVTHVMRQRVVLVAAGGAAPYAVAAATALGPAALRGLALVSPYGLGDPPADPRLRLLGRAAEVPVLGELALLGLTSRRAVRRHLEDEVFAVAPERADAARQEAWYRAARRPGARRALVRHLTGELELGVADLLPHLEVPLWLAWGRQATPGIEAADLWLQRRPAAELHVFESCGALPHLDCPADFARRLGAFVSHLPR